MCDYSLHAVASRPAEIGETLGTTYFRGTQTRGFANVNERHVAVCLLPGRNWHSKRMLNTEAVGLEPKRSVTAWRNSAKSTPRSRKGITMD